MWFCVVCVQADAAATRPKNCQLYVQETDDLMDEYGGLSWQPIEEWWEAHLSKPEEAKEVV